MKNLCKHHSIERSSCDLSLSYKMLKIMVNIFKSFTATANSLFLFPGKQGNNTFSLFCLLSELVSISISWIDTAHALLPQVVQGLVIGKLTSHCTEQTLLRLGVLVFAGVGLGMVRLTEKSSTGPSTIIVCRWAKGLLVTGSAAVALTSCA